MNLLLFLFLVIGYLLGWFITFKVITKFWSDDTADGFLSMVWPLTVTVFLIYNILKPIFLGIWNLLNIAIDWVLDRIEEFKDRDKLKRNREVTMTDYDGAHLEDQSSTIKTDRRYHKVAKPRKKQTKTEKVETKLDL